MNKVEFLEVFDVAAELNSECVFVEIMAVDVEEVIVIPKKSFGAKKQFYKNAYNDELVHVMNEKVEILGYSHGDYTALRNHI